jgi:small subunit ribosomal protein S2
MSTKVTKDKDLEKEEAAPVVHEAVLTPEEEARVRTMMDAGVFYGHIHSRTNPKMTKNILSTRSGVEVINLIKTMEALNTATKAVEAVAKAGGKILFVGTTPATKDLVKALAEKTGMPFIIARWPGGMLTNWAVLSTRIAHFRKLKNGKAAGEFDKYTKKEQLDITKELEKLNKLFGGIEDLMAIPQMVVIADLNSNIIAAKETKMVHVPTIALVNTDNDPSLVEYPIPANDRSPKSVAYILSYIEQAVLKGKGSMPVAAPVAAAPKKAE